MKFLDLRIEHYNLMKQLFFTTALFCLFSNVGFCQVPGEQNLENVSLTLIPPSPITNSVDLDVRAGIWNHRNVKQNFEVSFYINKKEEKFIVYKRKVEIDANSSLGIKFTIDTKDKVGNNKIILVAKSGMNAYSVEKPIEIIDSKFRSTQRIGGAWAGIYHWSEEEGKLWNTDIKKMSDDQWKELVRSMHSLKMDVIVIQEVFRNQMYVGKHNMEKEGYHGNAFYPSLLYPGRMAIAAKDPIEAILSESDKKGMSVFLGVGMYAWFDFTPASLEWHKQIAKELWKKYGHHASFYGWYISEESSGSLDNWESNKEKAEMRKREMLVFFKSFKTYCTQFAPDKPIMLATNSNQILKAMNTYPELLKSVDILCPFGFSRMEDDDLTGRDAAMVLQKLCDDAHSHLWLDLEAFLFHPEGSLYPRSIEGIISDLKIYCNFEKILCYQYPGIFNSPQMSIPLGGNAAVKLYLDYKKYIDTQSH